MKRICLLVIFLLTHFDAMSHAEHDKARYVAPDGVDEGRCEKVESPCKTIGYAVIKANKGDKVLVSAGQYLVTSVDELFYLTSTLVPIYGGYSRQDHFKAPKPDTHVTSLVGVPQEYKEAMSKLGFNVITDGKAVNQANLTTLRAKLAKYKELENKQTNLACINGRAGNHACNKIDLVAHLPLKELSTAGGNDIWGHVDLNTGDEYAIMGVENGAAVVSLKDPFNPIVVGKVSGTRTGWRDIKTYQFYDLSLGRWKAYAYVSADGASDRVTIIDLSDLPNSIREVGRSTGDSQIHNIYVSNVNYSTGVSVNGRTPLLHSMGSNLYGGAHRSYSLQNPERLTSVYVPTGAAKSDYTHDGTSFVVTDNRVAEQCQRSGEECDIFVDFNENTMRLWDQTDQTSLNELGTGLYANAEYTHSGWWTEDKKYVYVHDELDERNLNENTALVIFDVTDLNNPVYKGRWIGDTTAIDHNGFVRGNRYYMSNYERGLTVLDITNPVSPIEVGFFDTYPLGDRNAFNGAWGVYPFLPSGLILVSDINSGLYILKDNTKNVAQGQIKFQNLQVTATEGETVEIKVQRANGSAGAISIEYQTLWGSATEEDFTAQSGTLNWADGDTSDKIITLTTTADNNDGELDEKFSLDLFNVQGGAALYSPAMAWVTIPGIQATSAIEFDTNEISIYENKNAQSGVVQLEVSVNRFPPYDSDSVATVTVSPINATEQQDFNFENTELSWAAGEEASKTLIIEIIDDEESEVAESFTLQLTSGEGSRLVNNQQITITVLDDDSNPAPSLSAEDYSSEDIQNYQLIERVSIIDNDENLEYNWQLISDNASGVTLLDADKESATISITQDGIVEIELTITDPASQSATTQFTIEKLPQSAQVEPERDSSSSGFLAISFLQLVTGLCFVSFRKRRFSKA